MINIKEKVLNIIINTKGLDIKIQLQTPNILTKQGSAVSKQRELIKCISKIAAPYFFTKCIMFDIQYVKNA